MQVCEHSCWSHKHMQRFNTGNNICTLQHTHTHTHSHTSHRTHTSTQTHTHKNTDGHTHARPTNKITGELTCMHIKTIIHMILLTHSCITIRVWLGQNAHANTHNVCVLCACEALCAAECQCTCVYECECLYVCGCTSCCTWSCRSCRLLCKGFHQTVCAAHIRCWSGN